MTVNQSGPYKAYLSADQPMNRRPQRVDFKKNILKSDYSGQNTISATAAKHGLSLVTRNAQDFEGLGIEVINPWSMQDGVPIA